MFFGNEICNKIRSINPDIGECGIHLNVDFDDRNDAWSVKLRQGNRSLTTFVETEDASECINKDFCLGLEFQIVQLKDNIKNM